MQKPRSACPTAIPLFVCNKSKNCIFVFCYELKPGNRNGFELRSLSCTEFGCSLPPTVKRPAHYCRSFSNSTLPVDVNMLAMDPSPSPYSTSAGIGCSPCTYFLYSQQLGNWMYCAVLYDPSSTNAGPAEAAVNTSLMRNVCWTGVIMQKTVESTCEEHISSIQCGVLISHLHDVQTQVLQSSFHHLRLEEAHPQKQIQSKHLLIWNKALTHNDVQ